MGEARSQRQQLLGLLHKESDVDRKFLTEEEGKKKLFNLLGNVGKTVSRLGSKLGNNVDRGDRGESDRDIVGGGNVVPSSDSNGTGDRDLDAKEAERLASVVQQAAWTGTAALAMSNRHWRCTVVLTPEGFLLNHAFPSQAGENTSKGHYQCGANEKTGCATFASGIFFPLRRDLTEILLLVGAGGSRKT